MGWGYDQRYKYQEPVNLRGEAKSALAERKVRRHNILKRRWHLFCILKDKCFPERREASSESAKHAKAQDAIDNELLTKGPVVPGGWIHPSS